MKEPGLSPSEKLLQSYGVRAPEEIDLDAIAWELGAKVKRRRLHSCEARIVGRGGLAIISVDDRAPAARMRFSIAHELGHWHHHRGMCLICRKQDIGMSGRDAGAQVERTANRYASDLILPRYILDPLAAELRKPDLADIAALAKRFGASLTATLIKLVQCDRWPLMLVRYGPAGRQWFARAPQVPARWFPRDELHPETRAFELMFGSANPRPAPPVAASKWFDTMAASSFPLTEQSFRLPDGDVIATLLLTDQKMLRE